MIRRKWLLLPAALACAAALLFLVLAVDAPPAKSFRPATVLVPKGSSVREAARRLADGGVLVHPLAFRALALATGTGHRLAYGEYAFPDPPSALAVWRKMVRGEAITYSVTVPEGANLYDVATLLAERDLCRPEEFVSAASSRTLLARLGVAGSTAEGFLFPETYRLVKSLPADEIVEVMVRQFRRAFPPEMEARAKEAGFSLDEIVTIASIVEKETAEASERPLVSAIIRNRLSLGMPLQMDPTVIYGLKKFGEPLTKKDLATPTPYNTYVNAGLPPGPIANPGRSALSAALSPARTDYLYFVSRNDGTHRFSRTLSEHNRAVAAYQKGE